MKRIIAIAVMLAATVAGAAPVQADHGEPHDWACVALHDIGTGFCQRNPLPERLPEPGPDDIPEPHEIPGIVAALEAMGWRLADVAMFVVNNTPACLATLNPSYREVGVHVVPGFGLPEVHYVVLPQQGSNLLLSGPTCLAWYEPLLQAF